MKLLYKSLIAVTLIGLSIFAVLKIQKKPHGLKIGIIQIVEHESLDKARDGFIDEMKNLGYNDADFDIQIAGGDISNLNSIAHKFVNDKKDLIFIGTEKHVIMINCNIKNRDFSLAKNIIETHDSINQIKLMHKPNSTKEILIAVDNSGEIVVITVDLIKEGNKKLKLDKYEVVKTQKYNSKIDFHDNSPWSVDCQYPYIIIGSNNRTIFVFDYENLKMKKIINKIIMN